MPGQQRVNAIRVTMAVLLLAAVALLGACGGDDSSDRETALEQALVESQSTEQTVSSPEFIRAQQQSSSTRTNEGDFPYTPQQVIELFGKSDVPLFAEEFAGGDAILDVEEAEEQAVTDKYGPFLLYVLTSQRSIDAVLLDRNGNKVQPDSEGIYWELLQGEIDGQSYKFWSAEKPFKNVVLWWLDGENKQTDEGWNMLNGILDQLPK